VFIDIYIFWLLNLCNSFASLCSTLSLRCIKQSLLKSFDPSASCLLGLMMRGRKSWAISSTACWIAGAREEKCMGT